MAVDQVIELRHLRYFVALAEAGTFTHAAGQLLITQPTLSQQIRRLEDLVGANLLHRRRDGVQLTVAGTVLLDASRHVLSLVDHGVSRAQQAAGLGRPRLRVIVPPRLPDALTVRTAAALHAAAAAADVDIAWLETPLDAGFTPLGEHRADAGLGWLTASPDELPSPLDAMSLGEFGPDLWIPARHPAARRGTISLGQLAAMDVIHGPRRAEPGTYDAWAGLLRAVAPRFAFTDPPLRHSLPTVLMFAATGDRPTAVLTGPAAVAGTGPAAVARDRAGRPGAYPRHGPGEHPGPSADRDRGSGVAHRPAAPAAADPVRCRVRRDPAGRNRRGRSGVLKACTCAVPLIALLSAVLLTAGTDIAAALGQGGVEQLTLATGQFTTFVIAGMPTPIGYTTPDGLNIVASRPSGNGETTSLARYTLSGPVRWWTATTALGARLLIQAPTSCIGSNSLLWFNPGTGAEQWLIRAPANQVGVVAAVPFYSRQNGNL